MIDAASLRHVPGSEERWAKKHEEEIRIDTIVQGVEALLKMDYYEFKLRWNWYIGNSFWEELKRSRRILVGGKCECGCGNGRYLEMHHDIYPDFPFHIFDCVDNVRVLCRDCHQHFHNTHPYVYLSKSIFNEMVFRYRDFKPPVGYKKSNIIRFF